MGSDDPATPGRGYEVTPDLVMGAATRDLPEQVAAFGRVARTLDEHRLPAGAFGNVPASSTAVNGHEDFLEGSRRRFALTDEHLNTMIAGMKLAAAAIQRFDANNAARMNREPG
jgi:hypothetical protein